MIDLKAAEFSLKTSEICNCPFHIHHRSTIFTAKEVLRESKSPQKMLILNIKSKVQQVQRSGIFVLSESDMKDGLLSDLDWFE